MFLNHAEKREGGKICLNMVIGGSAGHGGIYKVDVDEGQPEDPLLGRKWDVSICDHTRSDAEVVDSPTEDKSESRLARILEVLGAADAPMTKNALWAETGVNNAVLSGDLEALADSEQVFTDTSSSWKKSFVSDLI